MRADAQRRRHAIITTAATLFRQHGNAVSLNTIAKIAGVAPATLYRNFPDRETLIAACTQYLGLEFLDFQEHLLAEFHPHNAQDHVRTYADKLLTMGLSTLIPAFIPPNPKDLASPLREAHEKLKLNGQRFIALGQASGEIGPGVTHLEFVVGLLSLSRPRTINVEACEPNIQERMIDLYLAGIKTGHERA